MVFTLIHAAVYSRKTDYQVRCRLLKEMPARAPVYCRRAEFCACTCVYVHNGISSVCGGSDGGGGGNDGVREKTINDVLKKFAF